MAGKLSGKTIAILATDGFEQSELLEPKEKLEDAGATIHIIAPKEGGIFGWDHDHWGERVPVDHTINQANPDDYDALVLPGGVMNPDKLRIDDDALKFVKSFFEAGKPVSAICHGPQILINCEVVDGRKMTSYPSIKKDLINAGANWVDEKVVTDQGLTTSRTPDDLPAFIKKTIEEVLEGVHAGQHA